MRPRHEDPAYLDRTAHAPYNFVPLPDSVVTVDMPPSQDRYSGHSGWFECVLETCSPTYVRGMVTLEAYEKAEQPDSDELSLEEKRALKEAQAPFYSSAPEQLEEGRPAPAIPGSSLRGMLRSLVEIAGHGKMRWVNESLITFRAVAAENEDPLKEPYQRVVGNGSRNVRAGYLKEVGQNWQIEPAQQPQDLGWPAQSLQGGAIKVKDRDVKSVDGFLPFKHRDYKPAYFRVSFDTEVRTARNRSEYMVITRMGDEEAGYAHSGALVCSGNMLETAGEGESPRRNYALVLSWAEKAEPLEIDPETIRDYRNSLTPFQESLWGGKGRGCLKDGAPVFYVVDNRDQSKVAWFGHTPNFRIPARTPRGRIATPASFVSKNLTESPKPDLVEAIFGWVAEGDNLKGQPSQAGRVSVTDASFVSTRNGVWYSQRIVTPRILASPKPTTFQHYLVQDASKGHNPQRPSPRTLAHYGTDPSETEIRGHKLYWHKGANPEIEVAKEDADKERQLTRMNPVNPGVKFQFRVYFDNLREEELGALAWVLQLPGEPGQTYRHKLGMGKPLGMGSVAITSQLYLTDRPERYRRLFDGGKWASGAQPADTQHYIDKFEEFVLGKLNLTSHQHLHEAPRIRELLALLQWREGDAEWLDKTRYQLIEHQKLGNEYKNRPVLPTPLGVLKGPASGPTSPSEEPVLQPPTQRGRVRQSPRRRPPQSAEAGLSPLGNLLTQIGQPVTAVLVEADPRRGWSARLPSGYQGRVRGRPKRSDLRVGQEVQLKLNQVRLSGEIEFEWP